MHPRRVERESNTSLHRECQHQLYWDAFGHAGMFLSGMINRARSTLPCHVAMSTVMSCLFHCTQFSESPLPISPPPPPPSPPPPPPSPLLSSAQSIPSPRLHYRPACPYAHCILSPSFLVSSPLPAYDFPPHPSSFSKYSACFSQSPGLLLYTRPYGGIWNPSLSVGVSRS